MKQTASAIPLLIGLLILPLAVVFFISSMFIGVSSIQAGFNTQRQDATATANALIAERSQARRNAIATQAAEQALIVSYSSDIAPILQGRCVYCHGPESIIGAPPNGLELDTYENIIRGSLFLPVIVRGQPQNSSLILLLRSGGMPAQADPLPEEQIQLIAEWITQGALDN